MAKSAQKDTDRDEGTNGAAGRSGGETTSGYFRRIFRDNPELLDSPSNADILNRWLKDHSDHNEVPQNVKNNLANIKSVLRKNLRKTEGKRGRKPAEAGARAAAPGREVRAGNSSLTRRLEPLEEQIDECLSLAKSLDREGLESVIRLLRRARNEVVWKMGE